MNKQEVMNELLRDIASVIGLRDLPSGVENVHEYADEVVEVIRFHFDDINEACEYILDTGKDILDQFRFEFGYCLADRIRDEMNQENTNQNERN